MLNTIEYLGEKINKVVMKNDRDVNYAGMVVVFGIPLIAMIAMCTLILGGKEN